MVYRTITTILLVNICLVSYTILITIWSGVNCVIYIKGSLKTFLFPQNTVLSLASRRAPSIIDREMSSFCTLSFYGTSYWQALHALPFLLDILHPYTPHISKRKYPQGIDIACESILPCVYNIMKDCTIWLFIRPKHKDSVSRRTKAVYDD